MRTLAGVDLAALAQREGTPLYVYSAPAILARARALRSALAGLDAGICYAVKANGNRALLALLAGEGVGADIVSGGELRRALAAGIPADPAPARTATSPGRVMSGSPSTRIRT